MSYENPKRAIDTQSAQHLQNMQNSLSKSFGDYTKTVSAVAQREAKEEQLRLQREAEFTTKMAKELKEFKSNVGTKVNAVAGENTNIFNERVVKELGITITKAGEIKTENSFLTQEQSTYVDNTKILSKTMLRDLTRFGTFTDGFNNALLNIGKPGGLAHTPSSPNNLRAAMAFAGNNGFNYSKNIGIDMTQLIGPQFTYFMERTNDGVKDTAEITTAQLQEIEQNKTSSFVQMIIDPSTNMQEMATGIGLPLNGIKGGESGLMKAREAAVIKTKIDDLFITKNVRRKDGRVDTVSVLNRARAKDFYKVQAKLDLGNRTRNDLVALYNSYKYNDDNSFGTTEKKPWRDYKSDITPTEMDYLTGKYADITIMAYTDDAEMVINRGLTPRQRKLLKEEETRVENVQEITDTIFDESADEASQSLLQLSNDWETITPVYKDGEFTNKITIVDLKTTKVAAAGNENVPISTTYNLKDSLGRQGFAKRVYPGNNKQRALLEKSLAKKFTLKYNPITGKNEPQ